MWQYSNTITSYVSFLETIFNTWTQLKLATHQGNVLTTHVFSFWCSEGRMIYWVATFDRKLLCKEWALGIPATKHIFWIKIIIWNYIVHIIFLQALFHCKMFSHILVKYFAAVTCGHLIEYTPTKCSYCFKINHLYVSYLANFHCSEKNATRWYLILDAGSSTFIW